MIELPLQISLEQWDRRYERLKADGLKEPWHGGQLSRHAHNGDTRLERLLFDNSAASLNLWNFLLTENVRLEKARQEGKKLIGVMKDLGTVPVMVYSHPDCVAFYPDGAWWIPCIMESNSGLLEIADSFGIDDSFCPVRAMVGAFATGAHFPLPDLSICSVGATCDDFSAIAQRINGLGFPIFWWEIPHRRPPEPGETSIELPGGLHASFSQVAFVKSEMARIKYMITELSEIELTNQMLASGIMKANQIRACLNDLRQTVFTARIAPLPALELLIAEMMAIHYCSDRDEVLGVLWGLLEMVKRRVAEEVGYFGPEAVRVFWINPVADIKVMNVLEKCGGRICGTEYLFTHALDHIPTNIVPLEALARMALVDPMVGPASDRAWRICDDIQRFGAEAVLISKIPGASHCALESSLIADEIRSRFNVPIVEIEVSSLSDASQSSLEARLCALVETVKEQKKRNDVCFSRA